MNRQNKNIHIARVVLSRLLCVVVLSMTSLSSFAQYSSSNSFMRRAIVRYDKDAKGFYQKVVNEQEEVVSNIEKVYAFDKKASNLYVMTYHGNYEITLTKDYAKVVKKNKSIPQLKDDELSAAIKSTNAELDSRFANINAAHQQELEAARQRAIEDSIAAVRRAEAEKEAAEKKKRNYMNAHSWQCVPTGKVYLRCEEDDCGNTQIEDSVWCVGINNDTLFYLTHEDMALDVQYTKVHYCKVPQKLKERKDFAYHNEVYADSLIKHKNILSTEVVGYINYNSMDEAIAKVKKMAPYGYVESWSWDDEFSVTFEFSYRNLNKRTIKYIDVYWVIQNDVGDIRKSGHFSGTGPVEYLSGGSWDWDNSYYYVAGDASTMIIKKIIITYTNGTKQVLTGNMIKFD